MSADFLSGVLTELVAATIYSIFGLFLTTILLTKIGRNWFYRQLLKLYPAPYRRRYGAEMLDVFQQHCQDQQAENGSIGVALVVAKELVNVFKNASQLRVKLILSTLVLIVSLLNAIFSMKEAKDSTKTGSSLYLVLRGGALLIIASLPIVATIYGMGTSILPLLVSFAFGVILNRRMPFERPRFLKPKLILKELANESDGAVKSQEAP